jgi:hypothetical protein
MFKTLYFFCYYSYLLGDLNKSKMYYTLLNNEFKTCGTRDSLKKHQFLELKKIKEAINTGNISRNKWIDENVPSGPSKSDVRIKQPELVGRIHTQGIEQLKEILQDDIYLYNIEHPCHPYGAVDMVYMGKDTIYPVEVKRGRGEHDLIGQISKYDLHHRLQLHYKHYEHVKSVTICHSYNPFTIHELKKMDILTLSYTLTDSNISIKCI